MSNLPIFDVAGSAMNAQSVRLSTVASNLANADSVSGDPNTVFRAKQPVFATEQVGNNPALVGVRTAAVQDSTAAPIKRYEPGNPLADGNGYVYAPDIDPVAQMVDLISATRSYQANVEVFNSAKETATATLNMGR
ncbi:flagellar basal body rod protein FlgC [Pseudoxanthomonas spadix]|jgi:flagellar basal-body rod protein FlgC|uniref:Flagellar basal-body rod protein FlgC n=1 Tax=Pseudoxanthomonas spadix (strain BD-a59) TaxID=1045855 RepID=G7UMZ3_PSEUP|nr:flagellar basal body rod protein FlgC [Pseudoxanthomonas spadix]AER55304.1 flagellar basal body rod protein FlgC [Pseudoxanthomonas spadix BD-a59]MBP3975700.1 flagellar basal body rod protein FlgC [Pseudoxanthomonas spadix]RMW95237.1 flagellar basal body rod protein FlgC [Pseudoxanthomonas spadix]